MGRSSTVSKEHSAFVSATRCYVNHRYKRNSDAVPFILVYCIRCSSLNHRLLLLQDQTKPSRPRAVSFPCCDHDPYFTLRYELPDMSLSIGCLLFCILFAAPYGLIPASPDLAINIPIRPLAASNALILNLSRIDFGVQLTNATNDVVYCDGRIHGYNVNPTRKGSCLDAWKSDSEYIDRRSLRHRHPSCLARYWRCRKGCWNLGSCEINLGRMDVAR